MAGGTCGEERNAELTPGVRAWPRGYYDPRAARQLGSRKAWPKCGPQDDNAAPPRRRAHRLTKHWRIAHGGVALPCRHILVQRCARLALAPYFSIGLREHFYEALAAKLNGLMLKMGADPAIIGRERERDYEIEVKLAWFKQMLKERLAEVDAADQAAALSVARPRLKA